MQKVGKINLKVLDINDKLGESCLKFKLEGTPIDYIVANTIRRTMLADIPIYAFSDFKFDKNTSVLHNDYLKNRFRNLPVIIISSVEVTSNGVIKLIVKVFKVPVQVKCVV
jgi:DNA-directed RNA polymerase alpha subunit